MKNNYCLLVVILCFLALYGCNNPENHSSPKSIGDSSNIKPGDSVLSVFDSSDSVSKIYLTFDDGPYSTTPNLIRFLNDHNIKASFFIVGSQVEYSHYNDSVFNAVKSNSNLFRIYNHTYSHAVTKGRIKHYYKDPKNVWNDIQKNKSFGFSKPNITRLPGTNAWRLKSLNKTHNLNAKRLFIYLDSIQSDERIFGWDFEWTQKESKDSVCANNLFLKIENSITSTKHNKSNYVLLLHDYLFRDDSSLNNLLVFLNKLKNSKSVAFKWAEEYPGIY